MEDWFDGMDDPFDEDDLGHMEINERRGRVVTKERQRSLAEKYATAKAAKVGSVIVCPTCGDSHTKTTYHKIFCSNGKKSKKDCKSRYHNTIHPERLERIW
ncbi:hypothetical protein PHYNN_36 [Pantoea phage Phynn]|nr:hypothetical protein PHYNN_36 [Pantoea phage Phynn]